MHNKNWTQANKYINIMVQGIQKKIITRTINYYYLTLDLVAKMFPDRKKKHGKQNDCKLRIIIIRSTFPLFCSVRLYSSWPEHHLLTNMAGSLCFVLRQHNCYWPERRLRPVCSDQVGPSFTDTTPHHFMFLSIILLQCYWCDSPHLVKWTLG